MLLRHFIVILVAIFFSGCVEIDNFSKSLPIFKAEQKKVYTSDKDVLMFILDSSGSMAQKDGAGKIKIVSAKRMLKDILNQIDPKKTNVGLISFSSSSSCESELLIEPSNNNLNYVSNVSSAIQARGSTPLAASIRQAGEILKNIHHNVNIIIISDGEESCGGNPIAEARKLKSQYGINASLYVIGYSVGAETEKKLQELSQAGGGNYYSAEDNIALDNIISKITDKLNIKSDNWQGSTYKFKINFDSGSSKLKKKYIDQIKKFADYLKNTGYSAELQGHTDSMGSAKQNKKLSKKRALSVADMLIQLGVPKNHVYAIGFGELAPIASNKTKEGRYENRRVEAHIIKYGHMDISHINAAISKNIINVKNATKDSFIGYYKIMDPNRTYDKYHAWIELYANGQGIYGEYFDNKNVVSSSKNDLSWQYLKSNGIFILDFSNNGRKPNWANFKGTLSGNTNKFKLSGHWGNGTSGVISINRISISELNCMKKEKKFKNGVCKNK